MGSMNCMNELCRGTASSDWKKGWVLKSGGFAVLCYNCGSAYENSVFCETFHLEESGWRECRTCRKRVHCGCIASRCLYEYMDSGGIQCISCAKRMEIQPVQPMQIPSEISNGTFVTNGIRDARPVIVDNKTQDDKFSTERLLQLTKALGTDSALEQHKREEFMINAGEPSRRYQNFPQPFSSSPFMKDNGRQKQGIRLMYESPQPSLNYALTTSLDNSSSPVLPFPIGHAEGEQRNSSQQGQRARQILPKPPKPSPGAGLETNKGTGSQPRVARPPAEGRGRNQLLPRYWPRITDQELQQLSGDLKSTIVPLFEKILSASDAGRIGRLVLPKACAEAYFPAINQSEGIPIRIQDIKGKEWTFQFRFWPNNNSRMYVLEGVTPCIQNMQLQAGDTVTFSRIDPGGQLVIGCRKATNNADAQDSLSLVPYVPNGDSAGETSFSGAADNMLSKNGGRGSDDPPQQHMNISEKKKARNIKNKRLLMHSDDAMDLRLTWKEAQDLFRPPPDMEPIVSVFEDLEVEEYVEPPIFGKRTIFTSRPSGEQEQLAQCDICSKWRRLPVNALLSAKWTCSENIWDMNRSSCSAPEDINIRDVDFYFGTNRDSKQRRISDEKPSKEGEPTGLDALATAAVLGDNITEIGESSVGATTRHPRHRPGCSCIVCIQPPSGKGKHEPTCKCNVCLTVKRRFKTLMMRKKKRQSEREAELAQERDKQLAAKASSESEGMAGLALLNINNNLENDVNLIGDDIDLEEAEKGQLDLNCDPHREDEILAEAAGMMSLTTLINAATLPMDMFLEQSEVPTPNQPSVDSPNTGDAEKIATEGGVGSGNVESGNNVEAENNPKGD